MKNLKPLTFEGRFECGLDEVVKNKIWAFVAVTGENYGARLGIAIANQRGYTPIPEHWAHADSHDVMQQHADDLNEKEGLTRLQAVQIVCSTMDGRSLPIIKDKAGKVTGAEYRDIGGGRRRRKVAANG
jgi:hypothetical protein